MNTNTQIKQIAERIKELRDILDMSSAQVAKEVGMEVFLLTDCLINKESCDISAYPNGNFEQLIEYIKAKG